MSNIDVSNMCRTCLALDGILVEIHGNAYEPKITSVANKLSGISSLTPTPKDGLPEKVCLNCISEINRSYSFKLKCENSDSTLRQMLRHSQRGAEFLDYVPENSTEISGISQENEGMALIGTTENKGVFSTPAKKNMTELKVKKSHPTKKMKIEKIEENFGEVLPEQDCIYETVESYNHGKHGTSDEEHVQILTVFNDEEIDYDNQNSTSSYYIIDTEEAEDSEALSEENIVVVRRKIREPSTNPCPKVHHSKQKEEIKCPHCTMYFVYQRNLDKHVQKFHTGSVTIENDDEVEFENIAEGNEVEQQEAQEENNKEYMETEDFESVNIRASETLENEKLERTDGEFKCQICNAGFAVEKSLRIHMKLKRCQLDQFQCKTCFKFFLKENHYLTHLKTHDLQDQNKCEECNVGFNTEEELQEHKNNIHKNKPKNQCTTCNKVFTMYSTLKDHMRIHTGEKPFVCPVCGKGFTQNPNLRQHMMRHENVKPFKCKQCPDKFVSKGELNSHVRKHTGEQPFVCEDCGSGFTTSSSLVKHKRIHTGERPYGCEFCPMRFSAWNTCKNHERTHTGEKPYACDICQKRFTQRTDLTQHMQRQHIGLRPFSCEDCDWYFAVADELQSHMREYHKTTYHVTKTTSASPARPRKKYSKDEQETVNLNTGDKSLPKKVVHCIDTNSTTFESAPENAD